MFSIAVSADMIKMKDPNLISKVGHYQQTEKFRKNDFVLRANDERIAKFLVTLTTKLVVAGSIPMT